MSLIDSYDTVLNVVKLTSQWEPCWILFRIFLYFYSRLIMLQIVWILLRNGTLYLQGFFSYIYLPPVNSTSPNGRKFPNREEKKSQLEKNVKTKQKNILFIFTIFPQLSNTTADCTSCVSVYLFCVESLKTYKNYFT